MEAFFTSIPGMVSLVGLLLLLASPKLVKRRAEPGGVEPRLVMQIVVSLVVLAAGLYVILSQVFDPDVQKWAFGVVGTVVGYWLPSAK